MSQKDIINFLKRGNEIEFENENYPITYKFKWIESSNSINMKKLHDYRFIVTDLTFDPINLKITDSMLIDRQQDLSIEYLSEISSAEWNIYIIENFPYKLSSTILNLNNKKEELSFCLLNGNKENYGIFTKNLIKIKDELEDSSIKYSIDFLKCLYDSIVLNSKIILFSKQK